MFEYVGTAEPAARLAFLGGDPPRLAAVSHRAVCVWEIGRPDPVAHWPLPGATHRSAEPAGSPDGRWLALAPDGRLKVYDLSAGGAQAAEGLDGTLVARFVGPSGCLCVARLTRWQLNGAFAFDMWPALGPNGKVDSLEIKTCILPAPWEPWPGDGGGWECYDLSMDGRRFALSQREKAVHLWDPMAGTLLGTISLRGIPGGLAWSPDGSRLAIDAGTTTYIHDGTTLGLVCKWKAKYTQAPGLAWSPDGRRLARTDGGTTVRVFDAATGREELALGRHAELVSVAFSPDGLTLATGTHEGRVRVWDVDGG